MIRAPILCLAAALGLIVSSQSFASVINEVEPNNSFATAQVISNSAFSTDFNGNIFDSTTIPHVTILSTGVSGNDFYRFSHNGGIVHIDIDGVPQPTNFDTTLNLYDSVGNNLAFSDDNGFDPGSVDGFNSGIFNFFLPAGDYVVEVGAFSGGEAGNYTLHISANVPEPATMLVLGFGAAGMIGLGLRRRKNRV